MSMFTRRRKTLRQKQEADRKHWEENSKKIDKSIQNTIKAAEIIDKEHPEFKSLSEYDRVKLFSEILGKLKN